jgi:hypothetical protein
LRAVRCKAPRRWSCRRRLQYGLNDRPQVTGCADTAKVASEFEPFRGIRNGPRHFIMDRLVSAMLLGTLPISRVLPCGPSRL